MKTQKALAFYCISIIASTLISFTGFSAHSSILEIVHGRPVLQTEEYAHHTVGVGTSSEIMCTGVLIAAHYAVTAAHCKEDADHGKIYFGTNKTNFVTRDIVEVTENPDYCKNQECGSLTSIDDNDILVIKFDGDLPEGFSAAEIAEKTAMTAGSQIHLAGFGADEHYRYDDVMKVTVVPFDSFQGQAEFKTDESKAGSCNGDSGGPAYVEVDGHMKLAGITSRGDSACRQFGIYTMVSAFEEWLKTVVK